ncbi:AAA domain-containing protein [Rhizobium ruizarguesonis]|uniref:AAA domain-containing protein n=1 Tax=Rhizobium ruizarguesonis TaxID=2081791 RepID=UPI001030172E|nr:AAA domain-containing protein [Rhizobium ruizarguesonis]TBD43323.1 DEAD/DEAH box helicase [Rhizobium ruizarguesonis]
MSGAEILRFLRDPVDFADDPVDADVWEAGFYDVAQPLTEAANKPLRRAQIHAWHGLADARAGLILGPPGTGKTHALAWMAAGYLDARRKAGLPCRILVSAFTRNAIINLIEAIAERCQQLETPPRIAFVGREPSSPLTAGVEHLDVDDAPNLLTEDYAVAGMTVWGLNRLITSQGGFTGAFFHLTCIDEASQMVLSHGLMAISGMAENGRVLVAGDNKQLPPIRVEHDHDFDGRRLGSSLYAFMQAAGVPEFPFDETFRLNEPLTSFPRDRFYENRYQSVVPERRLALIEGWQQGLDDWERVALDPEYPVCVLIHDGPPVGSSNPFEATIAARLGRLLFRRLPPTGDGADDADKWQHRLAIVSPHRAQNALIRNMLAQGAEGTGAVVETVDRIQGRERDAIVVSYTVADPEFAMAEADFIFSPERLNVTVTRARGKLILIISRRLLEVVPSDEEVVDKAETLREFIFRAKYAESIKLSAPDHGQTKVDVCVLPFDDEAPLPQIAALARPTRDDLADITPGHLRILEEIRKMAGANKWGTVPDYTLAKAMRTDAGHIFPDLRFLQRHGHIALERISGSRPFWSIRPLANARGLYSLDGEDLVDRVEESIMLSGAGRRGAVYPRVRDAFDWLGAEGEDQFKPVLDRLEADGIVQYEMINNRLYVSRVRPEPADDPLTIEPLGEELQSADYILLNHLEDREARRINFGVFEEWHAPIDLARGLCTSLADVAESLRRLSLHGLILVAEEGRIRSRMAEMARAVRYSKQRFRKDDSADRPYLVRGLKVELRNREKPAYDSPLSDAVAAVEAWHGAGSEPAIAFGMVAEMLRRAWNAPAPNLAGFQDRALTAIFNAWVGSSDERFVIAADTGSGKTEAACLPIIAGATLDLLRSVGGTRAILVYPRVRLAANQAQRLARYLASLRQIAGAPPLTLGLQNGSVPEAWDEADPEAWEPTGRTGEYQFPFFMCPEPACGGQLTITAGAGSAPDTLNCKCCGWRFDGWIGTKQALRATPPSLFLPTTESLHQWLNDSRYGPLFGDGAVGPRCVLADEIHLYTHIQGAQIGYGLRRLLGRCALNANAPLAVGMSATLGRPAHVWHHLVGGSEPLLVEPRPDERKPNPKGREYFYFVQPEVESRNRDVAGASTTIQAAMALAHNMHRRQGSEGGFRGIVFVDSIDKLKRLHGNYMDAEEGQNLASLRTRIYPDHPATGLPRRACCGDPLGCDLFRDGECWTFAATDRRQWTARGPYIPGNPLSVARFPVYSGSGARIETEIQRSDLVFSTASLEVGYDDPDMAFVYQHYAPSNLASFIQRKGRGGRGNDDRPVTGITLSIYSARDSWYYRRPAALLDSRSFEVPLNLSNPIVARGQLAALILDLVARREGLGLPTIERDGQLTNETVSEFAAACSRLFADDPFPRLGYADARAFVRDLTARFGTFAADEHARSRRARIDWVPRTLFGAADLPSVDIRAPTHNGEPLIKREDIALGLAATAPGNATRRWGSIEVHWRAPKLGRAPLLTAEEEAVAEKIYLGSTADLLASLPIDAREDLGNAAISTTILRPATLGTELIGLVRGGGWTPLVEWDAQNRAAKPIPDNLDPTAAIDMRSTGTLRGFPTLRFDRAGAAAESGPMRMILSGFEIYVGSATRGPGLHLSRIYWGADAEVRIIEQADPIGVSQTFTDAAGENSQFIGYTMESEGVRFALRSDRIDRFLEEEMVRLAGDPADLRWHRNQMLRYIVQRRARNAGINGYEAQRAAELVVTAADTPSLASDLAKLLKMWSDTALGNLFKRTYQDALSSHPLLSVRRIDRLMGTLAGTRFNELLRHVIEAQKSDDHLRKFLRSQLVHSLAVRLRQSFVLHGRGEEWRVVAHVKLPIQFGSKAEDIISVVENGIGGDGTTRTFVEQANDAFATFMDGFAEGCPNAAEDQLMELAHARCEHHDHWRSLDPRHPDTLDQIGRDLGVDFQASGAPSPQQLLRLLYANEAIGGQQVALYEVWQEVMKAKSELRLLIGREPDGWEIVSAASKGALDGLYPTLATMLGSYSQIQGAAQDGSLSPAERVADQIYRVSGRLCFDGCLACLHGGSDLMPSALADVTVSRRLLTRFMVSCRSVD